MTGPLRRLATLSLACLATFTAVAQQDSSGTIFDGTLDGIRAHYRPDRRTAVFDVTSRIDVRTLILRGETSLPAARESTLTAARATGLSVADSITILPHASLGDSTYGIVVVSVGNVRSRPGHSEELSTQVTMGLVVRLLKRGPGHYFVQSHDSYLGWLEPDAVQRTSLRGVEAWSQAPKVVVSEYFDVLRTSPDRTSLPVCDVVIGNILRADEAEGGWRKVMLADGRSGYLPSRSVLDHKVWSTTRNLTGTNIASTSTMFLGVPYLWGGTSSKGMDCSGFTKTVFRLNGLELSRDASQQVLMGRDVDPGDEFQNLLKGDLLFFGRAATEDRPERIVHVAIYLEERLFIHSSGRVRFGSFDPASPYYDEYNLNRFVRARRVIPESTVPDTDTPDGGARTGTLALWVVVLHSVLLLAMSYAESEASVRGGWNDSMALLVTFILGPVIAVILYRTGHKRIGAILLGGSMPAAAYIHWIGLTPVLSGEFTPPEMTFSFMLYGILGAGLLVVSLFGSLVSFTLLRQLHTRSLTSETDTTS